MREVIRPRALAAALLVACGLLLAAAPVADEKLKEGKTLEGVIEDGDAVVTSETIAALYTDAPVVARSYSFEARRDGPHFIDLRSPTFDGYLMLRDASGKLLAEDDDGLVAYHARILAEFERGETYTIQACALHGQRGPFELTVNRGEPEPGEGINWSEREIEARIQQVFREDMWRKVDAHESEHYLILTDSSAGKKFGKILDKEIYAGFQEEFPFVKPDRMRHLPIYLFNKRDDYVDFLMRNLGMSKPQASATGGIAYMDYYATSYTSPRDPVHFHECAHQIMSNLLGLGGGGSWYQEGVAEYYEDKVSNFNREAETRMAIRTDQWIPLRDFMGQQSILFAAGTDTKGGGGASGSYGQAASIILFLKEGPYADVFPRFLETMGRVPRSDLKAIEAVLQDLYGLSIQELEAQWKDYFAG